MKTETECELIEKHMGLLMTQVNSFKELPTLSREDYKQIGLIALIKAIRKHDPKKSQLQTVAWVYINNALITAYNSAKNKQMQYISNEPATSEVNINNLLPKLNDEESNILKLKMNGYTFKEISSLLLITQKQVKEMLTNIYLRIRADND